MTTAVEPEYPPLVVLEWLRVGGVDGVRIVAQTQDESIAHDVADTMCRQGLLVWVVDLSKKDLGAESWCGYDGHHDGGGFKGEREPPLHQFVIHGACGRRHAATHPCPAETLVEKPTAGT